MQKTSEKKSNEPILRELCYSYRLAHRWTDGKTDNMRTNWPTGKQTYGWMTRWTDETFILLDAVAKIQSGIESSIDRR